MGKAAMEALAFTLAKEERKHGVRVNIERAATRAASRRWHRAAFCSTSSLGIFSIPIRL
jgi:NAD(P)-dependent dehydrogenase (short-subunit alcohol dehydrogenase family)